MSTAATSGFFCRMQTATTNSFQTATGLLCCPTAISLDTSSLLLRDPAFDLSFHLLHNHCALREY
eukprot:m.10097 g.10097  ORF g.10097 m.10097 type:complete len:65 (-) comp7208_c0_seq1:2727-2921(-)